MKVELTTRDSIRITLEDGAVIEKTLAANEARRLRAAIADTSPPLLEPELQPKAEEVLTFDAGGVNIDVPTAHLRIKQSN